MKRRPPIGDGSRATELLRLATDRFRFGSSETGEPFAVELEGPNVALPLRGGPDSLKARLAGLYGDLYQRAPGGQAMSDALLTLEDHCHREDRQEVHLRIAPWSGGIVLDLGWANGQAVVVHPDGWEIVRRSPALFRRTELTGALPEPARHGDLQELDRLLNVSESERTLLLGWLVAALLPDLAHPILLLRGQPGAAKSSAARTLTSLIDPSAAPLRATPRDEQQWALAAAASYIVALDNVSRIPEALSDLLCRAVTGEGFIKRRLYSDSGLTVLSFRRPVIVTSIDPGVLKGDLADRMLSIELEPITTKARQPELVFRAQLRFLVPSVLGGLLDLLAAVLKVLPQVSLPSHSRLADFERVLAAIDEVRGTNGLAAYRELASGLAADVLDSDAVAAAVARLMEEHQLWEGTPAELMAICAGETTPNRWPATVQAFGIRLKTAGPALRAIGIEFQQGRSGRSRFIRLSRVPEENAPIDANAPELGS